jgi:sortase (surface protein transpeptidase)
MGWRARQLALDALTVALAVGGLTLVVVGGRSPVEPPHRAPDSVTVEGPAGPSTQAGAPAPGPLARSVPVRLDIPAIRVSTAVVSVGLNADGTIAVPPLRRGGPAGWYRYLVTPGEVGPAVILGHVDSARDGPAVFYRLRELRPGDTVAVHRLDGSTAVFTISQVAEYPKSAFPADAVYGPVHRPALRLVTCGGAFDPVHGQYRGNVVAYAELSATTPRPPAAAAR